MQILDDQQNGYAGFWDVELTCCSMLFGCSEQIIIVDISHNGSSTRE